MHRTRASRLSRRGERALLVAVILLAFTRAVWSLGDKSLWWDESLSLHRARLDLPAIAAGTITLTDNTTTVPTTDDHPPLYFLLLAGAVRLWGESEFALRFLSLACVVLLVPLLYCTGRRVVDRWAGLAGAVLAAVSPMYLWYGQEARPYALVTLLSLVSLYCFVRAFLESPAGEGRRRAGWAAGFLLASLGMVLTHYLSILVIVLEVAVLIVLLVRRRGPARLLIGALVTIGVVFLVVAALAAGPLLGALSLAAGRPGVGFVPLPVLLRDVLNSFSLGVSVDVGDWFVWLADLFFLLFAGAGFVRLAASGDTRAGRAAGWLLAGYLVVPIALLYLSSYIQPAYMTSRHLMLLTPAFYLLLAAGLTWLRGRLALVSAAACLLVAGGVAYSTRNYFRAAYDKDPHREWGAYLHSHTRPGDVVVVDPPQIADLYGYYAGSDVPWVGLPLLDGPPAETQARLQQLLAEYDRVWLATSRTPQWGDPDEIPETWLNDHAFRVDYTPYGSASSRVGVAAYVARRPLLLSVPEEAEPLDVRYLPSLRLAGYDQVSPARSGENLHVQLFWAVDQAIPTEASVSLRLVDAEGHAWGRTDACPFDGLFPMWQWAPGAVVQDEHEIAIDPGTPPGSYQLEMVLVEHSGEEGCLGPAGQAIPPAAAPVAANRGDRVLLGTVDVERGREPASRAGLDIEHAARARFGGLVLIGSAVEATQVKPGERIDLRLYWQATGSSSADQTFRLLLLGPDGQVVSERVVRPVGDGFPSSQWQAGDLFEGQFWWEVPAGAPWGEYWAALAPVEPAGEAGLTGRLAGWLRPAGGRILLDRFRVAPVLPAGSRTPAVPIAPPQGLAVQHPLTASLGDQVRFLGYDLVSETIAAGHPLTLTLYWQALAPMDTDYTVFAHLLGPDNRVPAQKDSQPRAGTYPTTRWQPGEVITDTTGFGIPAGLAPGRYWLEVGMYHLETNTRLPVTGADGELMRGDRILLGPITVAAPATPISAPTRAVPPMPFRVNLPFIQRNP